MEKLKTHPFYRQGPIIDQKAIDKTDSRRLMAEKLLEGSSGLKKMYHPLQGVAQLAQAGVGAYLQNKSDEEQAARQDKHNKAVLEWLK